MRPMTWSGRCNPRRPSGVAPPNERSGVVTLELILMLPVWLIVFFAMVEFAVLISNRQQLALASRVGAAEASITDGLEATAPGDPVPANILQVINDQLESAGIHDTTDPNPAVVFLEHNILDDPPQGTAPIELLSPPGTTCPVAPISPDLPPRRSYVRVTVYVPARELTCNLLDTFGFDITDSYIGQSTTFRHEFD